ncbi:MAG: MFS transporter [Lentisphaeraceae bacterium]|nr:MFS transporter [Lentisphaeraceae bacterium]
MRWPLVILSYLSVFALGLIDNARGACYPYILDTFELSNSEGALLFSLSSAAALVVNLFNKMWLPKFGAIKGNSIGLVFLACGALTLGLGSMLKPTIMVIYASSILIGVGLGFCGICINLLVVMGASETNKRKVVSGMHGLYGVASFIVPFVLLLCFVLGLNWGVLFVAIGLLPLLFLFYSFQQQAAASNKGDKEKTFELRRGDRLFEGLFFGFYVASELLLSSRLVLYLQESKGFSDEKSSLYLSLFFVCLLTGRLLMAVVKISLKSKILLLYSVGLTLLSFAAGFYIHPFFLAFCGLTMSIFFPCGMTMLSDTYKAGFNSMTASVITMISIVLIIGHVLFGYLAENYGVDVAMLLAPLCSLITLAFLVVRFLKKDEMATSL